MSERVADARAFDSFSKEFAVNVQNRTQLPLPRFITAVQNNRIQLVRNHWHIGVHLPLLAFRVFGGEFDCPRDHCWGYRLAELCVRQHTFLDHQGEARSVLARCFAEGLGGVRRNLFRAKCLYEDLLSSQCPWWVTGGEGAPALNHGLEKVQSDASTVIQAVGRKYVRRKDRERFFIFLCHHKLSGGVLSNYLLHYILVSLVGF